MKRAKLILDARVVVQALNLPTCEIINASLSEMNTGETVLILEIAGEELPDDAKYVKAEFVLSSKWVKAG